MDTSTQQPKFATIGSKRNADRQFSLASLLLVTLVVAVIFALPLWATFPLLTVVVICQITMRLKIARLATLAGLTLIIRFFIFRS